MEVEAEAVDGEFDDVETTTFVEVEIVCDDGSVEVEVVDVVEVVEVVEEVDWLQSKGCPFR